MRLLTKTRQRWHLRFRHRGDEARQFCPDCIRIAYGLPRRARPYLEPSPSLNPDPFLGLMLSGLFGPDVSADGPPYTHTIHRGTDEEVDPG